MTKEFQAYGNAGRINKPTAKQAALAYFQAFPKSRKCNVVEGKVEGNFFVVTYGRTSTGDWPQSFKGVTKTTAQDLPDEP